MGGAFRKAKYEIRRWRNPRSRTLCVRYGVRSEGGPRRRNFVSLRGKQKFLLFACPVASQRLCYGARPSDWISEFAVRIFVKKSSDFNQKAPPIFRIRILGDCCLAPPKAGLGFGKDFEGIFEIQKQFLPAQTEVRFAKGKHKFEKFINQSFFFRLRRKAKR